MLRIDALERKGRCQALTQVALEDVCDSSWKGGYNLSRIRRDQLHSKVSEGVIIIKANVREEGSYGEMPRGWQVSVDFSLNKCGWLTVDPSSVPGSGHAAGWHSKPSRSLSEWGREKAMFYFAFISTITLVSIKLS